MDQQQAILKAIETLGKSENAYAKAVKRAAEAKYAYDIKVATETLAADGSEKSVSPPEKSPPKLNTKKNSKPKRK